MAAERRDVPARLDRRLSRLACDFCDQPHTKLCDYPMNPGTCDKKLCEQHVTEVGAMHINRGPGRSGFTTLDYCPDHMKEVRP
jgi:hypothetical protein